MLTRPLLLLRLEGLALLLLAITLYASGSGSWWLFALALFVPDLAMLGYAGGPRLGAGLYNLAHTTVLPLALGVTAFLTDAALPLQVALIWLAHIGLDRMVGYGLEHPSAFGDTHLGPIGRRGAAAQPHTRSSSGSDRLP